MKLLKVVIALSIICISFSASANLSEVVQDNAEAQTFKVSAVREDMCEADYNVYLQKHLDRQRPTQASPELFGRFMGLCLKSLNRQLRVSQVEHEKLIEKIFVTASSEN